MKQTSFNIGNFWFHVKWDEDGSRGIDQGGRVWYNRDKPTPQIKSLPHVCSAIHTVILSSAGA